MKSLPDYQEALARAMSIVSPIEEVERVPILTARGRVLREAVTADRDLPPFHRAQMDGYAVRAAEVGTRATWSVVAEVPAGAPAQVAVPPGCCVKIATGAPLPDDVDTVIQHELSDRRDPVRFEIDSIERGHAVHPRGADARAGMELIPVGTRLRPHHVGIAASVGAVEAVVARRPRVTVLTSGDEVIEPGATPLTHQIRNSNGPMLTAVLAGMGAAIVAKIHFADDRDATIRAVGEALRQSDCLITVGGVSAGERDYLPAAFDAHGIERALEGAAIQPGKPVQVGRAAAGGIVIALPGNPVSCLVCAHLFCLPILRAMTGDAEPMPWRDVALAGAVKPNPRRRAFRPAILLECGRARVPKWAGSGDLTHTAPTHGVVELPVQADAVPEHACVRFLPWVC